MTEAEQNRLVVENMGLVPAIAAIFRGGAVEYEDLLSAGCEGLVKAARSYDPALSKFATWATTQIRTAIWGAVRSARSQSQWYPKETGGALPPLGGDSIEKIYEWDAWGDRGNAEAMCETWSKLDSSPEDLSLLYGAIKGNRAKFAAAFISLTGAQRKLVTWVFLDDPERSIAQAARELGVSYFQAIRMLKKALKIMREVITRMESNTNSGGNIANGHPSSNRTKELA